MKTKDKLIQILMLMILAFGCNEGDDCNYSSPCVPGCNTVQDFEQSDGNWSSINGTDTVVLDQETNALFAQDLSGASFIYNDDDFPQNLILAGCALVYDVKYSAGQNNQTTASNSLWIYEGLSPASSTVYATFVLNAGNLINTGTSYLTIEVILELATGQYLPANTFGEWRMNNSNGPHSSAVISQFNNLIQGNFSGGTGGLAFFLDNGSNPVEQWWYDNFCFKQCCD